MIPVVFGVIIDSILPASIFIVSGSMSQNIGRILFHESTCGVAAKVKGVVITSPDRRKPLTRRDQRDRSIVKQRQIGNFQDLFQFTFQQVVLCSHIRQPFRGPHLCQLFLYQRQRAGKGDGSQKFSRQRVLLHCAAMKLPSFHSLIAGDIENARKIIGKCVIQHQLGRNTIKCIVDFFELIIFVRNCSKVLHINIQGSKCMGPVCRNVQGIVMSFGIFPDQLQGGACHCRYVLSPRELR